MSANKHFTVFIQLTAAFFINFRKNNYLYRTDQIFNLQKSHYFIIFCIFDFLFRNQSADNDLFFICYFRQTGFFIQIKIGGDVGSMTFHQCNIFFKRMPADINPQNFLFKLKKHIFGVFTDIRELYIELFPIFRGSKIEQGHLTSHGILIRMQMIHDLRIHAHELLSGSAEGIKRASFDEVFNRALIQIFFIRLHSGQKIVQIMKRTTLRTLCNNRIDNRTPYTFDSSECIADRLYCFTGSIGIIGYGKTRTAFIDIRRQQMNAHAAAGSNITGNLWRIINDGGHQCCHKFYRIIMFEPGCLDGNNSVTGCM